MEFSGPDDELRDQSKCLVWSVVDQRSDASVRWVGRGEAGVPYHIRQASSLRIRRYSLGTMVACSSLKPIKSELRESSFVVISGLHTTMSGAIKS